MIKNLLIISIFLASFINFSKADSLKEFQIENISIGDSALNHFTKENIEKKKLKGFIYEKKDFYSVTFYKFNHPQFEMYDAVQLHLKNNDNKYTIYSIAGRKNFDNNFKECVKTLNSILPEMEKTFKNSKTIDGGTEVWKNSEGHNVKTKSYWITLSTGGDVSLECYDQPEEMNIIDGLSIALDSKLFSSWLTNK